MKAIAAAALSAAILASPAQAMPFAPSGLSASNIVHVHGGCGVGFHRTSTGVCRRDGTVMVPLIRTCPTGYVRGSRGRCVRR